MVLFAPALAGGIGLLRGKSWARLVIFLLSLVLIFFFPIGTILGGFGFVAMRANQNGRSEPFADIERVRMVTR